jgi:L-histidine N-alpha-methyltransferase
VHAIREQRRVTADTVSARDGPASRMLEDVRAGLSLPQKELPPTYFYDSRGSRLFDEITRLPEYYLTRAEHELLEQSADEIVALVRPRSLAELGAGTADKSRTLLRAIGRVETEVTYIPVDVSAATLSQATARLYQEFPSVHVIPVVGDMRGELRLPSDIPRPLLYALLGSTIGNFPPTHAERLLARMRADLDAGDRILLGIDLIKDPAVLEAAYNDKAQVTAEFNRNVLNVLNRELGSDFDLTAFRHRAFYSLPLHRIEMHLVSTRPQTVRIPGAGEFAFADGETVRTEISCKYDRGLVAEMFAAAGLGLERWITNESELFALAVGAPTQ